MAFFEGFWDVMVAAFGAMSWYNLGQFLAVVCLMMILAGIFVGAMVLFTIISDRP